VTAHVLVFYDLASDYLARRGDDRAIHLKLVWEAAERGELVLAGALADPADQAVLLAGRAKPRRACCPGVGERDATSLLAARWRRSP